MNLLMFYPERYKQILNNIFCCLLATGNSLTISTQTGIIVVKDKIEDDFISG
jgi:hypothetical protein